MKGYAYEIRRYRLCRFAGARPHHPQVFMTATGDTGQLVDLGTIDRATPETRDAVERQLAQLVTTDAGPARLKVEWLRTPRGLHAGLFRGLQRDVGVTS